MTINNKLRGQTVVDGALHDNGDAVTPNTAAGVTRTSLARPPRVERMTLTDVEVDIAEADDFGSVKLCDLPAGTCAVLGLNADLVVTGDAVITDVTAIDYAFGSVAISSTDFSNAGEDDLTAEGNVAAMGVINARTTAALSPPIYYDAGSNAVYLNLQATIATDATVTVSGTVDLIYVDLGS